MNIGTSMFTDYYPLRKSLDFWNFFPAFESLSFLLINVEAYVNCLKTRKLNHQILQAVNDRC